MSCSKSCSLPAIASIWSSRATTPPWRYAGCANNVAYVMVGPPVDPGEDEKTVRELLNFDRTKIVCGGTTSQIVSKYSGKELTTCLNYLSPDVPPIGKMEGIDLVTEGVITLGKTLDVIKRYEKQQRGTQKRPQL